MSHSVSRRGSRFGFRFLWLLLGVCGLWAAAPAGARTVTLSFELAYRQYSELDPIYLGGAYYTVAVVLYSDTAPLTMDEVDSPDKSFIGTESGSFETYFTDLGSLLSVVTNGNWTLVINQGDPSSQTNTFTVAVSGLTTNDFCASQILAPPDEDPAVPTNAPFFWAGPAAWNNVQLAVHSLNYAFFDGAYLPGSATQWVAGSVLPAGTNEFEVTYTTNAAVWFTISTPVNRQSQPFTNWVSTPTLAVFNQSGFVVSTNTTNAPVTLANALNAPTLVWTNWGDAGWFGEVTNSEDGVAAAQSVVLNVGQTSTLQTTVTVTGAAQAVFFWWEVQDDDYDYYLDFYVDGTPTDELNGGQSWSEDGPFILQPGVHTLQWIASVDDFGSDSPTNDSGGVDEVSFVPVPTLPVTDSPTEGEAPVTVQFTSAQTDSAGNVVTDWNWDFGDGATSTAQNPSHTYAGVGTYTPSLTVQTTGLVPPAATGLNPVTVAAVPPVLLTPREAGTNFGFKLATVLNQSYTVWGNSNLLTANWVSYTNVTGDGTLQTIIVPIPNRTQTFFRLSSP